MRKYLFLTVLTTLLTGCTLHVEEKKKEEKHQKEQYELEKQKLISNTASKYNILYLWDTLYHYYSIDYLSVIETQYQLIDDFEIIDIFSQDSSDYVSIKVSFIPSFYFDFPITKEQEKRLLNVDDDLLLVVSISEMRKIKLDLAGEFEDIDNTRINLISSRDFIGKGKIIDLISISKIKSAHEKP